MLLRSKGLRVAVHPHSSLSAHRQILKLLHKQRVLCVKTKYYLFFFFYSFVPILNICFVLYTAIAIILHKEHCLKKRKKNFSHVVNNVHSDVVSNNLSEILLI